ncbi:hypothetical protein [Sphaerospermopsis sp. LEGE 08334]|jgi:hypothetical protein|uniref:hypothetical protein n=1 Tax=Sphaerospermopsis sp. LEGE 08334 TaxID=1828651 RepID=UPI001881C4F9|nr:hypothetical protein [Sphaerospermopsis sp. LEGE 08334]MBE9058868.1 hypothetical protein [Sphaerospermopsis sp. LEGE 08334]
MKFTKAALVFAFVLGFLGITNTMSIAQSLSDLDSNAFLLNPKTGQFLGNVSSRNVECRYKSLHIQL